MQKIKKLFYLFIMLAVACTPVKHPAGIQVALINDGCSLQFKGLDKSIINDIARDTNKSVWQSLVPVYRMPADTDLKNYQPVQPGRYSVNDTLVVFTPDTPFVKGQTYFVRNYRLGEGASLIDYMRSKTQPGKMHFIDLIFKQ